MIFKTNLFGKTSKELRKVIQFLTHTNTINELKIEAQSILNKLKNPDLTNNQKAELHIRLGVIKATLNNN